MPSHNTYHLTWVSLTLNMGISSWLLRQSAAAAPYLGRGYLLTAAPPDLERGVAPLGPPAPAQQPLLGGSKYIYIYLWLPRWLSDNEPACQYRRCRFDPWIGNIP